ncbi:RECQ4 helicase, partial [Tichodroma muraria]|nr:RECQ4 helicase [Tichodroma muraria]
GKIPEFWVAAAYHAGLSPRERRKIQRDFMENRIRVLCATISFGMGLDKRDIRGIVHYNIPGNLESYVQEIGRAGRDGIPARCHLFVEPEGQDLLELRRHIHENSVDFWAVKTLIQRVFAPCKCREIHGKIQENSKEILEFPKNPRICRGHERSIPIQEMVEALDLREEGIETLLCLLELHPQKFLELFPPVHSRCQIRIPGNSMEPLREAARGCPALGFVLARDPSGTLGIPGSLEFDVVALSDSMGWEFRRVRESLRSIQWESRKGKTARIQVEFREFSFHFRAYGDLDSRELDSVCDFLHSRVIAREKSELRRLQRCFQAFQSVAFPSCIPEPPEKLELEKNSQLRELLREYFEQDPTESEEDEEEKKPGIAPDQEEEIRAEIRKFLAAYPEEEFSGRAVARIFHGIGSPRFPSQIFGRDRRFWRRLLPLEFRSLSRLASQEILAFR